MRNNSWIPRRLAAESRRLAAAKPRLREGMPKLYASFRAMYWDWRREGAAEAVCQLVCAVFGRDARVLEMESGQDPDPGPGLVIMPSPADSAVWLHIAPDTWTVYVPEDGWTEKDVELVAWLYESLKGSPAWWATTEIPVA